MLAGANQVSLPTAPTAMLALVVVLSICFSFFLYEGYEQQSDVAELERFGCKVHCNDDDPSWFERRIAELLGPDYVYDVVELSCYGGSINSIGS